MIWVETVVGISCGISLGCRVVVLMDTGVEILSLATCFIEIEIDVTMKFWLNALF